MFTIVKKEHKQRNLLQENNVKYLTLDIKITNQDLWLRINNTNLTLSDRVWKKPLLNKMS